MRICWVEDTHWINCWRIKAIFIYSKNCDILLGCHCLFFHLRSTANSLTKTILLMLRYYCCCYLLIINLVFYKKTKTKYTKLHYYIFAKMHSWIDKVVSLLALADKLAFDSLMYNSGHWLHETNMTMDKALKLRL